MSNNDILYLNILGLFWSVFELPVNQVTWSIQLVWRQGETVIAFCSCSGNKQLVLSSFCLSWLRRSIWEMGSDLYHSLRRFWLTVLCFPYAVTRSDERDAPYLKHPFISKLKTRWAGKINFSGVPVHSSHGSKGRRFGGVAAKNTCSALSFLLNLVWFGANECLGEMKGFLSQLVHDTGAATVSQSRLGVPSHRAPSAIQIRYYYHSLSQGLHIGRSQMGD